MYGIQIFVNAKHRDYKGDIVYKNIECRNNYLSSYFYYVKYIKDEEVRQIVTDIISRGIAMEKIQIITLLAMIKNYYV